MITTHARMRSVETTTTQSLPVRLNQIGTGISSLFHRKATRKSWPNPEQSTGQFVTRLGRDSVWQAKGAARDAFDDLAPAIKSYLDRYVEPISSWTTWSMYMIGRAVASSSPTIMFFCEIESHRREVRDTIKKSGILDRYPGFKTGHMARPPHFKQLVPLADEGGNFRVKNRVHFFPSPSGSIPGTQVMITTHNAGNSETSSTKTTIGGVLVLGEEQFYTTAAHPFVSKCSDAAFGTEGGSEVYVDSDTFSIDGDSEDTSNGEISPSLEFRHEKRDTLPEELSRLSCDRQPYRDPINTGPDLVPQALDLDGDEDRQILLSTDEPSTSLDYGLIEVRSQKILAGNVVISSEASLVVQALAPKSAQDNIAILAATSRGTIKGMLSATPYYVQAPESNIFQRMMKITLDGPLEMGDCGSWVVDAETGDLFGHIVVGEAGGRAAFLAPFDEILVDIERRFALTPSFPTAWISGGEEGVDVGSAKTESQPVNQDFSGDHGQDGKSTAKNFGILPMVRTADFQIPSGATNESDASNQAGPGERVASEPLRLPPPYTHRQPSAASPPRAGDMRSQKFRSLLMSLSFTPIKWENPSLIETALTKIPVDRIHEDARAHQMSEAESPSGLTWGYQDYIIRALMRWFKESFFTWVNNPGCELCHAPTRAQGMGQPVDLERAGGAKRVELYECTNHECMTLVRFPRYPDPGVLLETRRGRTGEWANCFGLLCRALGARVRWVWNAEDHNWVEVYSEHARRWIHADPSINEWDNPRLYTDTWTKSMSYVIAFSADGAVDVTRRYVRNPQKAARRDRCGEDVLLHILAEITSMRRQELSEEDRVRLTEEDSKEQDELEGYKVAVVLVRDLLSSFSDSPEGPSTVTRGENASTASLPKTDTSRGPKSAENLKQGHNPLGSGTTVTNEEGVIVGSIFPHSRTNPVGRFA